MRKLLIVLGIVGALLLSTLGIIVLMFYTSAIGPSEAKIRADCEEAILAARYNTNTISNTQEFNSIIEFIETNFDSIMEYRKSINISLVAVNDTSQRVLNPKYNNLYDELKRNNLESIKISSNKTIELVVHAVVRPTDSYNYDIKHSIVKGVIPRQKLKDGKVATLIKHKLIDQNLKIYYVIRVIPRFGW